MFALHSIGEENDFEFLYFPSLKYLHLHENDLRSIPPHIGFQKNLETLDISDNPELHTLPKELGNLKVIFQGNLLVVDSYQCINFNLAVF